MCWWAGESGLTWRYGGEMRLVVGISGASGAIYGIRVLEDLKRAGVEAHLVMSNSARPTVALETD